jgi:hypothetical protein
MKMNHPLISKSRIDYLGPINVHIVILLSASKLLLRITSLVKRLFFNLSTLSLLSKHGPNANGAVVLVLVEEGAIIRLIFGIYVISIDNNTFLTARFSRSFGMNKLRRIRLHSASTTISLISQKIPTLLFWTLGPAYLSFPPRWQLISS